MKERRIIDWLEKRSRTDADKLFVMDQHRSMTYGKFYGCMLRKAWGLSKAGVSREDRVVLLLEHGIDHLISYFACMHIAAVPVNLSISKPAKGVEDAARVTSAKYCIVKGYPGDLSRLQAQVLPYDEVHSSEKLETRGECSIAYMMFTSGTTGAPKAVITSHQNTVATASSILDFTGMKKTDRELISLPLSFTFGLGHIHALIMAGGEAFLTNRRYDTSYLTGAIAEVNATGFLASPAMLREMVAECESEFEETGKHLRYVVVNCTPMEVSLTRRLLQLLPNTQFYMYYGMTEASRCAYIHYNKNLNRLDFTGRRALNVELKIEHPDSAGVGEICMRGPNVMPGYWNAPEETKKIIDDEGWIHSGDLGIMDKDGYIKVLGRINDQISVDGMKCQPMEVERVIGELPYVKQAAVCGIPDKDKFQVVGAAVILNNEARPHSVIPAIQKHCASLLEAYKIPVLIKLADKFPANELGKVNRKKLASLIRQTVDAI
ncbi:MAG: acyl--CoA ligase [Cytophagales bacterium]|nr:acyl--CoA ligase [Cytophagales bacterium]